jgi:hypothetical protein
MLPSMDVLKMLAELRQEHARVEEAIVVFERLALGHGKRRGRPPRGLSQPSCQNGVAVRLAAKISPKDPAEHG